MLKSTNFCRSTAQVYRNNLDITDCSEISGMGLSSNGYFLYMVNDSPGEHARVFAYDKAKGGKPVTIEITGIRQTGFNPTKGQGYGDWEALAVGSHPQDPSKRCIIVADIGHNKARDPKGGVFRREDQQTRLIFVEEPTKTELTSGAKSISKQGYEFPIMYTPQNRKYDAEAMALHGDNVLIITKNRNVGDKRSFVFTCPLSSLNAQRTTPMALLGETTIDFSHVTDAFATQHFLALRTYIGLNFYAIADFTPGVSVKMRGCQRLEELRDRGQQEAVAYDARRNIIFMIGEGSSELFSLKFRASEGWAHLNKAPARTLSSLSSNAGGSPTPRLHSMRSPALRIQRQDGLALWRSDFDRTGVAPRISGACFSTSGQHLYVISHITQGSPLLYAFEKDTLRPTIIDIQGVNPNGYKATQGVGFGSWTSLDMCLHPTNRSQMCIVIADIGNSSDGTTARLASQQTRLVYVAEPSPQELQGGPSVSKTCDTYPIQYSDKNLHYDSRALAVVGDVIYIVCKSADKKYVVYTCPSSHLTAQPVCTLSPLGTMTVPSEVTDAYCTSQHLVLRTYSSINVYALSDIHLGQEAVVQRLFRLDTLKNVGRQHAMAYCGRSQKMYLFGQGSSVVYTFQFRDLQRTGRITRKASQGVHKQPRLAVRNKCQPMVQPREVLPMTVA